MIRLAVVPMALLVSAAVPAAEIYEAFPQTVYPDERYVIYSHGLIIEGIDPRPRHPEYGVYLFPEIKQALFDGGEFNLIAHQRPANTEIAAYVATLESWVRRLIDSGVRPSRITLVGFSRGGFLTAFASSRLKEFGVNTALMAVCREGGIEGGPPVSLGGHFLSIYETTDVMHSCKTLAAQSSGLQSFEEVALSTGRRHGAFYEPLPEWVVPLKRWIRETNR